MQSSAWDSREAGENLHLLIGESKKSNLINKSSPIDGSEPALPKKINSRLRKCLHVVSTHK